MGKDFLAEGLFEELKSHLTEGEKVLIPCSSLQGIFKRRN